MASFAQYRAAYEKNWASLKIRPGRLAEVTREANAIKGNKTRYLECEKRTGVPWWFIGLCHYRESHFNFSTYLGNGQSLNRVTTIVPKGRGPFKSFTDGAEDAMMLMGFIGMNDWSIARTAYRLEGFNGYGYHPRGVNSPYLYGGSTCYGPPEAKGGKFPRDHVFDPNIVDSQLGTLTVLKKLMELDNSINLGAITGASDNAKTATQSAIVAGGVGTATAAAATGWPWEVIIAILIAMGLVSLLVWHFMRRKDDEDKPAFETMIVERPEPMTLPPVQDNRK